MALASAAGGGWPPVCPPELPQPRGRFDSVLPPERTICVREPTVLPQSRIRVMSTVLYRLRYLALVGGPRERTRGPPLAQS